MNSDLNIKKIFLSTPLIFLLSCAPSPEEKEELSIITCNILRDSQSIDAGTRIKEVNETRNKIGEEKYLLPDANILEAIKYDLCEELVLNDPDYQNKLSAAISEEELRVEAEKRELIKLEQERIEKERKELERRVAEAQAEIEKKKEEQRLAKEREEEEKRLAKQKEEEAKRIPKQEWRKVIEPYVVAPTVYNVTAMVFTSGSASIEVEASCQKGVKTKMYVNFKSLIPNLELNNSIGYCSGRTYKFSKYVKDDKELYNQLDLLPTISTNKYRTTIKNLNYYLVQDVDVEIYGAWKPDKKEIDPRQFPPLGESEVLNEPIKFKAKFGRDLVRIKQ